MEKRITESDENEIYSVISTALQALCREKPNDSIDFLSKKMMEIIGDDPKWNNQKKKVIVKASKSANIDDVSIPIEKIMNKGFISKFSDFYKINKRVSLGPKGQIFLIKDLQRSEETRVVKIMKKKSEISSLTLTEANLENLIQIDHPNIGRILDIMEDEKQIYMVQDYHEGGDLYNFILKHKKIGEKICKIIIKQLLEAVNFLHQNNVCHRDIKPQNIFVVKFDERNIKDTLIKLTDFGASCYFKNCVPLSDFPGTPAFTSPEVINGKYDLKIDIWSIGIVSYFLLCGRTPYEGRDYDIMFKILNKDINFDCIESEKARNLLKKLLDRNVANRPCAKEALKDEWFDSDENEDYLDDNIGTDILRNMSKFIVGDNLKRSVYSYIISKRIYSETNNDLLKLFREIDVNNDGKLDINEIMAKYGQNFSAIPEEQNEKIKAFIEKVDINNSGFIEYDEFLTINNIVNNDLNKKMLKEVFEFFDITKNGTIEVEDLKLLFKNSQLEEEKINEMLSEFDSDSDQAITFAEFYDKITLFIE